MPYRGRRLADLILAEGQARAQGVIGAGQAWGGAVQDLGQIANRTLSSLLQHRQDAPRRELETLQLTGLKREARDVATEKAILPFALTQGPNGVATYDRDLLTREFTSAGIGDRLPDLLKGLDAADAAAFKVSEGKREALAGLAYGVMASGNTPEAFQLAVDHALANGLVSKEEVARLQRTIGTNPEKIAQVTQQLAQASPAIATLLEAKRGHEVAERRADITEQRAGTSAAETTRHNTAMEAIGRLTAGRQAAAATETARHNAAMEAIGRTRVGQTGMQWATDPTTGTARLMSAAEIRDAGATQAPTAVQRTQGVQYAKARPILAAVSELSEKINTGQGVAAKARGAIERAKATANLNDDVAEYESLISGFTPLIARALGHTGVLTELDVASVKAMYPRPGDSKSLRDRKIARIEQLMGVIEGAVGSQPSAGAPLADEEGQRKPIPGYPGTEQTYRNGKWIRTK